MKCPKCMEKRILDDVPVTNICPKCGSEMIANYPTDATHYRFDCSNLYCGHWMIIKDVHEEPVKP